MSKKRKSFVDSLCVHDEWVGKKHGTVIRIEQIHRKDRLVRATWLEDGTDGMISFQRLKDAFTRRTLRV